MTNTRTIGKIYEDMAAGFLKQKGYIILERNYRKKIGEIDIIFKDNNELVFGEVKYRKSREHGGAEFAIPVSKQNKIRRVADYYLAEHRISQKTFCRFDAILIDGEEITHVKNAW